MNKLWFRAGGAMALASAATWATAAGCSSSSASNNPGPADVDAAVDSGPTPLESGASAADDASAEASAPGLELLWNVVTAKAAPDGGAGPDGGDAGGGGGDAGFGGDAAVSTTVPVGGAQVCVYQNTTIPCVMSAADGTFTMSGVPAMADIVLTVVKDGYRSTLRAVETANTNMDGTGNPISLLSATIPDPPVPVTIDWQNKGQLTLFAIAPQADAGNTYGGDPGATVVLTPMSGSGPYFLHDDGTYDLSATSFVDVPATYFNLDPGNYELTFTDTVHNCAPISSPFGEWGYPAPPTSAKFPIVAGYMTGPIGIFCTAK